LLNREKSLAVAATSAPHRPQQNKLLAALTAAELEQLLPHLEGLPMHLGDLVYEPGRQLQYAYFPTTSIVSLHHVTETGATVETTGVGNEGVVGISLFMGGDSTSSSAVVQTAGYAYRIEQRVFKKRFESGGQLQQMLLRYTQAMMTQVFQSAACYRHHSVEQQLSRWLLATLDRVESADISMTQELVATMLGVRRESITEAAGALQAAGLIRYRRGHIAVLDKEGLEAKACECYDVVKRELARLCS
jgi:CRP-like cAMP-binding protein